MIDKPLTYRTAWRPLMAWIFGYVSIALWSVWALCLFFFAENATDIVAITTAFVIPLGADLAALASIVTFYVHGRTKEKLEDKHDDSGYIEPLGAQDYHDDSGGGPLSGVS